MTHRVHPHIFRIGETTTWKSRWFHPRRFAVYLREDALLREWLWKRLSGMRVSSIEMERSPNTFTVIIKTARPGILIGRGGEGIERLRRDIETQLRAIAKKFNRARAKPQAPAEKRELKLSIEEVRTPETDARIVAEGIKEDIEKRIRFRRVLKQTIERVAGQRSVAGVKIMLSGRLDGGEMSRVEWSKRGRIPLQTIRANVDYALVEAYTSYGIIGIKVWIYKGDVFAAEQAAAPAR